MVILVLMLACQPLMDFPLSHHLYPFSLHLSYQTLSALFLCLVHLFPTSSSLDFARLLLQPIVLISLWPNRLNFEQSQVLTQLSADSD